MGTIKLSKKERMLLEDEKSQEEVCVLKYKSFAQLAHDPALKQLFLTLASEEQKHYDTVSQLLQGQAPSMGMGQGQAGGQQSQQMGQGQMQAGGQQTQQMGQGQFSMQNQGISQSVKQMMQGAQQGTQQGSPMMEIGMMGIQNGSSPSTAKKQNSTSGQRQDSTQSAAAKNADKILCSDLLSTEKYVSGTYDTAIFEAAHPEVRQALQHIQKDEQKHGEQLFQYMNSHGMYQVQ